jgi:hypothetical protein
MLGAEKYPGNFTGDGVSRGNGQVPDEKHLFGFLP